MGVSMKRRTLLKVIVLGDRNPKVDDGFKVPKEKITCIAASVDVDEEFESSGVEETRSTVTNGSRSHTNRRYCDKTANLTTNSGNTQAPLAMLADKMSGDILLDQGIRYPFCWLMLLRFFIFLEIPESGTHTMIGVGKIKQYSNILKKPLSKGKQE
ncbi:hypothetical protein Gotur_014867, partial [Gossypium turneri]